MHHIVVWQTILGPIGALNLPVVYIIKGDGYGGLSLVRVQSLVDYFIKNKGMSDEWLRQRAMAVGLLIEYTTSQLPVLVEFTKDQVDGSFHAAAMDRFAVAVQSGTVTLFRGRKSDSTGLFWRPRTYKQAHKLLSALTGYCRYLAQHQIGLQWAAAASTDAAATEPQYAIRMAYEAIVRRGFSLVSYLDREQRPPPHRFYNSLDRSRKATASKIFRFPTKYFWPLLFQAFARGGMGKDIDETAELATHIMVAGGLRKSEGLHIWVQDVQVVEGMPLIFLHHPADGKVIHKGVEMTRREYLFEFCTRQPRNLIKKDAQAAGWKSVDGDDVGTPIYWLPVPGMSERLAMLLDRYLKITRPRIMAMRRAKGLPDHPYLLVGSGRAWSGKEERIGEPYTMSAFVGAWARGIGRLARKYDDPDLQVAKSLGTTEHATRHFYGSFLMTIGIDRTVITRCMHHRSPFSAEVYTRLTDEEINEILQSRFDQPAVVDLAARRDELSKMFNRQPAFHNRRSA